MRKNIDIDDDTIIKLKAISVFENLSVKALMEKSVRLFVKSKEKEQLDKMTIGEKEDMGLLLLMKQSDITDIVSEKEFFKALDE